MKESCFSAVMPVIGWNQWVKWVAPLLIAQSFIAEATTSATFGSSGNPSSIVLRKDSYISFGRLWRMTESLKTLLP